MIQKQQLEELGELSNEVLTEVSLQRQSKIDDYDRKNLESEWADVIGTLVLLAIELDIDMETAIDEKITMLYKRFELE